MRTVSSTPSPDPWVARCRSMLPPERSFEDEMRSPIAREILESLLDDDDEAMLVVEGRKKK